MKMNHIDLKKAATIIAVSLLLATGFNLVSPVKIDFIRQEGNLKLVGSSGEIIDNSVFSESGTASHADSVKMIDTQSAYKIFSENRAVFIDVRDQWDFADGHIPGAINLPEYKFEPSNPVVKSLIRSTPFIIYCGGDDCDLSKRFAEKFASEGFTNLYIFTRGWQDWIKNDFPVEGK